MGIEEVGVVFYEYCIQNRFLKLLLPISNILLLAAAVLKNVQNIISMGSLMSTIVYVVFILAVLLSFAKADYKNMSIGMGLYMLDYAYEFFRSLVKYQRLNWSALAYLVLWTFFAGMAYLKSENLKNQ